MAALPAIATGFVRKLYRILDQENAAIISWNLAGTSFVIFDDDKLNEVVLPRYFRGRLCAFRQQLREHGFQQVVGAVTSPISHLAPADSAQCAYFHEHFVRGYPGRLCKITRTPLPRRRISNRKSKAALAAKRSASTAGMDLVHPQQQQQQEVSQATAKRAHIAIKTEPLEEVCIAASTTSSVLSSSTASSGSTSTSSSVAAAAAAPLAPAMKQNPLFSDESDSLFGDWLQWTDPTNMASGAPVAATTDIAFSEDMLGALMNLVSNSMSSSSVVLSTSRGVGGVPETCKSNLCMASPAVMKKAASSSSSASGVYETHQFSDDTINSMMMWLGSGSTAT